MSHRLTLTTEIKDREAAIDALNANKIAYRENDGVLTLLTTPYNDTTINLHTGQVRSGDVDYARVNQQQVGVLRQWYAEAKYRIESFKEGIQITDRAEVVENGQNVVLLTWQTG